MDSVADWIDAKPPRGKYTFTRKEVVEAFPRMKPEVISATQLLQKNEMSGGDRVGACASALFYRLSC